MANQTRYQVVSDIWGSWFDSWEESFPGETFPQTLVIKMQELEDTFQKCYEEMTKRMVTKTEEQRRDMKEDMYEFICNYIYSEHSICPPFREACPYTKEELLEKAKELAERYELQEEIKKKFRKACETL